MNFSMKEIDSADGKWYRSLVTIQDTVGSIEDLKLDNPSRQNSTAEVTTLLSYQHANRVATKSEPATRIIAIEEIEDGIESEDEDIVIYEKPDTDASDEDEDPTLVQRDRPTAPV